MFRPRRNETRVAPTDDEPIPVPFDSLSQFMKIIDGLSLILAVARMEREIKWLRNGLPPVAISPQMAIPIIKGGIYTGKRLPSGRIQWIREADTRVTHEWSVNWRTAEACVLQPCSCTGDYE